MKSLKASASFSLGARAGIFVCAASAALVFPAMGASATSAEGKSADGACVAVSTFAAAPKKSTAPAALPVPREDELPVDISADEIEYDTVNRVARADGNVIIKRGATVLEAERAEVFIEEKIIYVSGGAKFARGGDTVFFSSGNFSSSDDVGVMEDARGFVGSWVFTSKKVRRKGVKYRGAGASFTTCTAEKPHYKIITPRLSVIPRRFVSASSALFYVGKIPVFWLPYWWHSLGDGPLNVAIEPGYNNTDGAFAKTRITYDYSDYARTAVLVDYFSKRGTGIGAESTHDIPDTHKSSVYLYRIREETTARDRWTAKTYLWQRISDHWSARSEINYSSDESFNESYFGESWKPVEREINSNVFVARQSTVSYTSIGVGRKQVYDPATGNYLNARTEAPSISYVRYRSLEYLGFYPEYSLGYSHVSSGHEAPYLSRFSAATSATAQKQMGRGFVASPFLGASEEYSESEPGKFYLYGKYFAGSGMRWYWARFSFLDLNYRYAQKFRIDSLDLDSEGIEDNSLGVNIFTFPTRASLWKVGGGYDFLRKEPRALSNEINFSGSGHSLFLNLRHNLVAPAYESALVAWAYKDTLALNAYHNAASKETVGLGASAGFPVGDKNKISAQYVGNLVEGEMKPLARQVKFERDLHCWDAWILYRRRESASREPVDEIFFNIALKMGDIPLVRKREIEKEFYPWRGR